MDLGSAKKLCRAIFGEGGEEGGVEEEWGSSGSASVGGLPEWARVGRREEQREVGEEEEEEGEELSLEANEEDEIELQENKEEGEREEGRTKAGSKEREEM